MGFFQNTSKPQGMGGKIMVNMMNNGHASLSEWGRSHLMIQKDDNILDIGCGGGANIKALLEKCPRGKVTGIDYSEISVEKSQKTNEAAVKEGRCEIMQGDVMELPFHDEEFQAVTAIETVYFWPDIIPAFKGVYRVLKTGGSFMICNECNGNNPKDEKWVKMIDGMKLYTAVQIENFLEKAGFSDIKIDENESHWICAVARKTV